MGGTFPEDPHGPPGHRACSCSGTPGRTSTGQDRLAGPSVAARLPARLPAVGPPVLENSAQTRDSRPVLGF